LDRSHFHGAAHPLHQPVHLLSVHRHYFAPCVAQYAVRQLSPDAPILITTGVSLIIAFGLALWLPHAAEKARDFAKRDITAAIVRTKGFEDGRLAGQLDRVNSLHGGAFRPFTQQPAVRALLLPLSVLGGNALLDFLALPGA
jgi:hypothetical protein